MRIAMVHASFAVRGGAERYVRDLAGALTDRGHEVLVVSRDAPGAPLPYRPIRDRISVRLARRLPRLDRALAHLGDLVDPTGLHPRDLRGFAPDAVHVHNWYEVGVPAVARLARAFPTCHTVHDQGIRDTHRGGANRGRHGPRDAVLALRSAWIARRLARVTLLYPSPAARQRVHDAAPGARRLRGSVLPLALPPAAAGPVGGPGDPATFLFLGALTHQKGIDVLLDAWRRSVASEVGTLLVAGDGPLRSVVEAAAAATASVRYLGYLDQAGRRAAFARAGWLVLPSRTVETFSLSCVEALVAGRPLITSEPAVAPMASPGSTLVFRGVDQLAGLLGRAAALPDGDYRTRCASAAADGGRLDWETHVDSIVRVYEALCSPTRASVR
jgi:glycosyltransferase involved in cell wall biosynthesis